MSKAAELAALIGSQSALSNRNLVINGAMQVWQRGTTIDTISNGGYLCDRWRLSHSGTDGNVDVDRSTDVPSGQGFAYSQKISMDASETSLDAADQINVHQRLEGQDLQQLAKGTSNAKKTVCSFWVRSSVASTYTLELQDSDNNRSISKTYTIDAADTWEKKEVVFDGDTTGALNNDNGRSVDVRWWIDAGSNYTSGTLATSWATVTTANRVSATTGWLESTSPEFYITGVQWELGEQDTPFEHRSYGDELAKCQRYYRKIGPSETSSSMPLISGGTYDTTQFQATYTCEDMRTQPTLETSGTAGDYQVYSTGGKTVTAVPALDSNSEPAALDIRVNITGATAGQYAWLRTTNTTAYLAFDAEL
jgi:hypothetical protein